MENIYAKKNTKIKYTGLNQVQINYTGSDNSEELLLGQEYLVEHTEVHDFYTNVTLQGVNGKFNSVGFKEIN